MNMPSSSIQRSKEAREAFFQRGQLPTGLVDDAILNSWQRCTAQHKSVTERVEYDTLARSGLAELLEASRTLMEAANEPLEQLNRTVSGAGYALLLTDHRGHALSAYRGSSRADRLVKQAFRQGVNLSEQRIGTSAMSCALSEGRPVAVSGPEHYLSANHILHCAAAPIIDPQGRTIGSIDITREHPLVQGSALSLVTQCAKTIERRLMAMLEPYLVLRLDWELQEPASDDMLIALGAEGELLGMTPRVREVMGLTTTDGPRGFQDLFDLRFESVVDAARRRQSPILGQAHSGLSFSLHPFSQQTPCLIQGSAQRRPVNDSPPPVPRTPDFGDPSLNAQTTLALRAMSKRLPILIQGDTGTGKEVMAQALHRNSDKHSGEFVAINCAAIPEALIEGELFGHMEGAYTGARRGGAPGKIEQADGGTLFLDEIGDMPLALQSRLLRVLETQEVIRLGGRTTKRIDFQLICATHRNLTEAVALGEFRDDLLYRIKGMPLSIPPLRERTGLREFLIGQCDQVTEGRRQLSVASLDILLAHEWPGNVRELRHALTYADVMAEDAQVTIEPDHLPMDLLRTTTTRSSPLSGRAVGTLQTLEWAAIEKAMAQEEGNVNAAAKRLGISRATLYRRLKQRKA
ncbi:sigma-54-dependent Fis family transcriptional regulator [Halomonas organivorans]|uniref:Transcriptional regulator of acetoin/glycerol metabolism n=1 Tax=Halomonas organivorans TaxID=257772 RepID=A0A7W5BV22_9GAMM|nr:sigma-54-dependent Fis family transcriptional regulator [Halomonas organivorans]MBB3139677.1 transcriptional regulator of acetoin/glycerol metabolism [Halomonas organivorans]